MILNSKDGIFYNDTILNELNDIDSIVFDCDGVLVDITNSYDSTIRQTSDYILKKFFNVTNPLQITSDIIDKFKTTGGFNDEVDLTYASILSLHCANEIKKNPQEFIFNVIDNADKTGIISVEKYLESIFDISSAKKILNYPGKREDSILNSIFDQLFFGPKLFSKLFNKQSEFSENGLIENDIVILNQQLIQKLKSKFGKNIAIVSGRGIESIRYSLKSLLDEFDVKNSAFLEDEPRKLAKPNPESLTRAISGMNSSHCLYVGDSMEDFIMANEATKSGKKTTFCGIIGTSKNPEQKRQFFEAKNVSLILDSIDLVPKVLNLE